MHVNPPQHAVDPAPVGARGLADDALVQPDRMVHRRLFTDPAIYEQGSTLRREAQAH